MRKKTLSIPFFILLLTCTTIGGIGVRTASGLILPVISMDPPISTAAPSETFTVNITVAGITAEESLFGWEAKLGFNPDVVNITSATRGPFLRDAVLPQGWSTVFKTIINNVNGSLTVGETVAFKMPPSPPYPPVGAIGNGTLATITFQAKTVGATLLHFEENWHFLYTVISNNLVEVTHEAIDGFFSNVHDVAVTNVVASPTQVIKPEPIFINVTVANEGDLSETFNVTAYYDSYPINTTEVTLPAGANTTLEFTWNTMDITGGTYTIKAEASTVVGETDIADNTYTDYEVTVLEPPVAAFDYSPKIPYLGGTVTFNSTSYDPDGTVVGWKWDFDGDGVFDAFDENVTHVYTEARSYTVTLNVTDNDGLSHARASEIIVAKLPSTIDINVSPSTIKPGQTITMTGSITPARVGFNVTILYRPGGTLLPWTDLITVLTNETSQYSYDWSPTTSGTYDLKSSWDGDATTSGAESSTKTVMIYLQPPISVFTVEPKEPPLAGGTVTFNATDSYDPDGYIVSYFWNFGDGNTTTVDYPVITHVFTVAGTYSVTLTVTDDDDRTDIATDQIMVLVHDIAVISVVPFPTTVKTGESVSINVTVTNEGNFTETFNVTAYYADTPIETQTGITLASGNSTTLTFNWATLDVAAGDYIIKAVASRVENETDSDNTCTGGAVTIEKQSSQITISVDPSTITIGKNTTISGTITPTRAGATVTIQYKPTEGDWIVLETVTTGTNGQYVSTWSPETAGTYEVKASWEGDATRLGAESNVDSVKIREATMVNIYLFAAAGVGIVIAATIALYFLRARKRTSV